MAQVLGVGGVFFKSRDPVALAAWYREHLGVPVFGEPFQGIPDFLPLKFQVFPLAHGNAGFPGCFLQTGSDEIPPRRFRVSVLELAIVLPSLCHMP